jgi:glycosyltransferase involved in cell wall biosynthesis
MGGMETHLHSLCGELQKTVLTRVIVANDGPGDSHEMMDGVAVTRAGQWFSVRSAPVCPRMVSYIRGAAADIVHLHLPNPTAMLAYQLSGHRGRLVLTWHSDVVRQRMMMRSLAPLEYRLMRRAAALVTTSPNYLESSPVLNTYRERTHVIPYGIPLERFSRREMQAKSLRARYGGRIVLAVGRLIYYKGFEFLIRAIAQVKNAVLLIVGEGPLRKELEDEAISAGVRERVYFIGAMPNDQTAAYYQAADVFVLPSIVRSEAFGIVQLEAMACGKPVVNTLLDSGVPYVSVDGVTGLTVPPRSPAALAVAINRLLDNPHLRSQYGAAALRRVHENFTLDLMARRTLELYSEVLGRPLEIGARLPAHAV